MSTPSRRRGALPSAPRPSLRDQFRERIAGVPKEEASLTPDEKAQMRMNFYLGLIANRSARFLEAVGLVGSSYARWKHVLASPAV
jgi:hypothetical protein